MFFSMTVGAKEDAFIKFFFDLAERIASCGYFEIFLRRIGVMEFQSTFVLVVSAVFALAALVGNSLLFELATAFHAVLVKAPLAVRGGFVGSTTSTNIEFI